MNKKKQYCNNCGKYTHIYNMCKEPIISIGIIDFKFDINENIILSYLNYFNNKYQKVVFDTNGKNNMIIPLNNHIKCPNFGLKNDKNYLYYFNIFQNTIKFLMIRRKNTLGYIEFIRGKYDPYDSNSIIPLFQQMIKEEIDIIENNDIDYIWNSIWHNDTEKTKYEYKQSKIKFDKLKNGKLRYNLLFYIKNITPLYSTAEWGFPKGRRNLFEKNRDCAIREFNEESGFNDSDYKIVNSFYPLNEVFYGTNNVKYKHIYYSALNITNKNFNLNKDNKYNEIGDIGWFTFDEAILLIRPYHKQRKNILFQLYMFLMNEFIDYHIKNENNNDDNNNNENNNENNI
jgi:8-oxo-dGTP pyrophosphatase MutT (NUDIX family)